jgi:hypothetical protein
MQIGLFSCLLVTAAAGWSPNRLHHVDTIGEGHLFRGSAPVVNGTFAFDALRTIRIQFLRDTPTPVDV